MKAVIAARSYGFTILTTRKLMHPEAGAIDTELPKLPERTHIMLDECCKEGRNSPRYRRSRTSQRYPNESIASVA